MAEDDALQLPRGALEKEDESDDALFYAPPRLVTHIDDGAIGALTNFYRAMLPAGGVLLDLMSSWVSHLPGDVAYREVIGHGMNAQELAANPRLTRRFVQDLNKTPALDLPDASVDGAMICVSIQYLQKPVAVLKEILRALRPGAPLVISFSNRCFPTKAVALWQMIDMNMRAQLVAHYLQSAGFTDAEQHALVKDFPFGDGDPLTAVVGRG